MYSGILGGSLFLRVFFQVSAADHDENIYAAGCLSKGVTDCSVSNFNGAVGSFGHMRPENIQRFDDPIKVQAAALTG